MKFINNIIKWILPLGLFVLLFCSPILAQDSTNQGANNTAQEAPKNTTVQQQPVVQEQPKSTAQEQPKSVAQEPKKVVSRVQEVVPEEEDENQVLTLSEEFERLKKKSNSYNEYKVIKKNSLDQFWALVLDSMNFDKEIIKRNQNEIASLQDQIEELKVSLEDTKALYEESEAINDSIGFFGAQISKATYNTIVWVIIFILLGSTLGLFYLYKNSNIVTVKTKREFKQLQGEYEEHKKKAQEKQIKLKRELQTQRNLIEELKEKLPNTIK